MVLTEENLTNIFEFQLKNPILVDEEIIEDIQAIINATDNKLVVEIAKPIYKFFTKYNSTWVLKYTDDLSRTLAYLNKRSVIKSYNRGGIPVFVIS